MKTVLEDIHQAGQHGNRTMLMILRNVSRYYKWWRSYAILGLAIILILLLSGPAVSQFNQMIDDVSVSMQDNQKQLELTFSIPVHYQWHFPRKPNTQFIVSLQALRISSDTTPGLREHIRIPEGIADLVTDMHIEKTENRNFLLYIDVSRPLLLEVKQDTKTSRIILTLVQTENDAQKQVSPEQ